MEDSVVVTKFIRSVGLTFKNEGLLFLHDYGDFFIPWESITHTFGVLIKKKTASQLPLFVMITKASRDYFYIDGNIVSSKYFNVKYPSKVSKLRQLEMTKPREDYFRDLITLIFAHISSVFIDKPLKAYLRSGQIFLPTFITLKDMADYCVKTSQTGTVEDTDTLTLKDDEEETIKKLSAPSKEREEWTPGKVLEGQYTVQEVRRGGMGTVYIVFDSENVCFSAMKTFQERYLWDENVIKQFIKEAEIWIQLDRHTNIVQAQLVKLIEGKPYIFLEYIQGTDLEKLLARERLTCQQAIEFAIQFCKGMHYAFKKLGLIHRDIKPSNCLLTREGILKITDFGLGKIFDETPLEGELIHIPQKKHRKKGTGSTSTAMVGTLPFMAPELLSSIRDASLKSDIYAFGVVLYMMLTGTNPFFSEDFNEVVENQLSLEPEAPEKLNPEVPAVLSLLVMKCLDKNPDNRQNNFSQIGSELVEIYRSLFGETYELRIIEDTFTEDDWINKGLSLESLSRHKEAILTFDQALHLNPESIRAMTYKGLSLLNFGKILEAISCFDEAMKSDWLNWELWSFKGDAYWKLGNREEALLCFEEALNISSDRSPILGRKGRLLAETGRVEEALNCYDEALTINPRASDIWVEKARLSLTINQIEQALACLKQALLINPRDKYAWHLQGTAFLRLGFAKEAMSPLNKALALDRNFSEGWLAMGDCHKDLGNVEDALKSYREVLLTQPDLMEAYSSMLILLNENKRWEEVLELVDKALEMEPDNTTFFIQRATALLSLGILDEALSLCQVVQEIEPENRDALLLYQSVSHWMKEEEVLWKRILPDRRPAVASSLDTLDGILSYFCSVEDALFHLETRTEETPQALFIRACLYFCDGNLDKAQQILATLPAEDAESREAQGLKTLIEENLEITAIAQTKKKKTGAAHVKKSENEHLPEESLMLALYTMKLRAYHDSRTYLRKVLEHAPQLSSSLFFMGKTYSLEGNGNKAQYYFNSFINSMPHSYGFWKEKLHFTNAADFLQTEDIYCSWIARFPHMPEPWLKFILYLAESGQHEKLWIIAEKLLRDFDDTFSGQESTALSLTFKGYLELYLKRVRAAEATFSRCLEVKPHHVPAMLGQGKCLEEKGELEKARNIYEKLLLRDSSFAIGSYMLAGICIKTKEYDEALAVIEKAIQQRPHSLPLLFKKGEILMKSARFQDFFALCTHAVSRNPHFTPLRSLKSAMYYENRKIDDATMELSTILSLDPTNLKVMKNLGILYIQSQNAQKALALFDRILSINCFDYEAIMGRGIAAYMTKNIPLACKYFEKACRLHPFNADLWLYLGAVYYRKDQMEESRLCWERAVRLKSRFPEAWIDQAQFYYEQQEYAKACQSLEQALRLEPDNPHALLSRARCYWKTGKTDDAAKSIEKGLSLDPSNVRGWIDKGIMEFFTENYELAFQSFDKAAELESRNAVAWYDRAVASLFQKNIHEAKRSLDRALALDGNLAEALIARFALAKIADDSIPRHTYLAEAQRKSQEVFESWAEEYQDSRDPIKPLKPIELREDHFLLPMLMPREATEPLTLFHTIKDYEL